MFIITEELTCEEGLKKLGSFNKSEDRWDYYMYLLKKMKSLEAKDELS